LIQLTAIPGMKPSVRVTSNEQFILYVTRNRISRKRVKPNKYRVQSRVSWRWKS